MGPGRGPRPLDGVIIEKNVALGELVDTSTDLFKIADLSHLRVMAARLRRGPACAWMR